MRTRCVEQGAVLFEILFVLFVMGMVAGLIYLLAHPPKPITVWSADGCAYVARVGEDYRIASGERLPDADRESCPLEPAP